MPNAEKKINYQPYLVEEAPASNGSCKVKTQLKIIEYLIPFSLLIVDYGAVMLGLFSAYWFRNLVLPDLTISSPFASYPQFFYLVVPLFYLGFIFYEGLYHKRPPFWRVCEKLLKISLYATAFTTGVMYFSGASQMISRPFIFFSWFFASIALMIGRFLAKRLFIALGIWKRQVLVIGSDSAIELLTNAFSDEPELGYQILGVIKEEQSKHHLHSSYPVLGNLANLETAIVKSGVSAVIIAMPDLPEGKLLKLVYQVQSLVKQVIIVPNLIGLPLINLEAGSFFNQKAIMLSLRNNLLSLPNRFLKRVFDLVLGCLLLIPSLPIMAVIGLLIKLDSRGAVLHTGKRLGKNGKEFACYKFRTMYPNGDEMLSKYLEENQSAKEEWEQFAKLRIFDPRVTRVGKWLRKLSLDELPQLFNVIKGEMSLVGPRPYLPRERSKMNYYVETILETTPGITGLWQVRGRNNIDFLGRLSLDTWYVRNWSLWLDISLLVKTVKVVLFRHGAA